MATFAHYRPDGWMPSERIKKWIFASLIIHGALLLFLLIKNTYFPDKTLQYVPTLRVDIVGLPDILKKDLDRVPPKSEAKPTPQLPAESSKPVFKSKSKAQLVEHEMALNEKRQKKISAALDRIKALQKVQESDTPSVQVKGNVVSPGTQLTGEAKEAAIASYMDRLHDRLKRHWALPVWLTRKEYSAQVRVFINSAGRIDQIKFEKSSGHPQFDNAAKQALLSAEPFPEPPAELLGTLKARGIIFGFPL